MLVVITGRLRLIGKHYPSVAHHARGGRTLQKVLNHQLEVWPRNARLHFHSQFIAQSYLCGFPTTRGHGVQFFVRLEWGEPERLQTMLMTTTAPALIRYHCEEIFCLYFQLKGQIILLMCSNLGFVIITIKILS